MVQAQELKVPKLTTDVRVGVKGNDLPNHISGSFDPTQYLPPP